MTHTRGDDSGEKYSSRIGPTVVRCAATLPATAALPGERGRVRSRRGRAGGQGLGSGVGE
ncbi:hypothetical protein [Amycolatopsis japonica]|uniref:hypothetical protein n=1 Tax=Amycolatopsis japonica TaxID=208439 RepID=UPI000AB1BC16|nr:hypothetical protein [Amycolatopsis japonica]